MEVYFIIIRQQETIKLKYEHYHCDEIRVRRWVLY